MIELKSSREIPSWFNPDKYKELEAFKAAEWLDQLRHRKRLLDGNPLYPDDSGETYAQTDLDAWRAKADRLADQLLKDPLLKQAKTEVFIVRGDPTPLMVKRGDFLEARLGRAPLQPVKFQEILDLARMDTFLSVNDDVAGRRWDCLRHLGGIYSVSAEVASSDIELGQEKLPVISVDLSASDTELKNYFKQWLKMTRQERGFAGTVRKNAPPYASWADYGVLPYLDLKIWGLLNGVEITAQAFADMLPSITGNHDRGLDSVRDNTILWAKKLMKDLSALEALAKTERDLP